MKNNYFMKSLNPPVVLLFGKMFITQYIIRLFLDRSTVIMAQRNIHVWTLNKTYLIESSTSVPALIFPNQISSDQCLIDCNKPMLSKHAALEPYKVVTRISVSLTSIFNKLIENQLI